MPKYGHIILKQHVYSSGQIKIHQVFNYFILYKICQHVQMIKFYLYPYAYMYHNKINACLCAYVLG